MKGKSLRRKADKGHLGRGSRYGLLDISSSNSQGDA
jgi:hypothetical protein